MVVFDHTSIRLYLCLMNSRMKYGYAEKVRRPKYNQIIELIQYGYGAGSHCIGAQIKKLYQMSQPKWLKNPAVKIIMILENILFVIYITLLCLVKILNTMHTR